MTQDYLDNEIDIAKKIFMYYTDKVYEYLVVGSDKYQTWYRDSLQLYYLLSFLESIIIYNNVAYIGSFEITNTNLRKVFDKVREYYRTEVEVDGQYGDITDYITTTPKYSTPYQSRWNDITYQVTSDNTFNFTLPFIYSNIDPKSLIVSIEGYGAISGTEAEEAYNINNNIFYWHHYFNLDAGMKVNFKYLQIAGIWS